MTRSAFRAMQRANPELARRSSAYIHAITSLDKTQEEKNEATHTYLREGGYDVETSCVCPEHS